MALDNLKNNNTAVSETDTISVTADEPQHENIRCGLVMEGGAMRGPVSYTHLDVYKRQYYGSIFFSYRNRNPFKLKLKYVL